MKKIFISILELFFPSLCVVCNNRLQEAEKHLCLDCLTSLPQTNYHLQPENRLEHFFAGKFLFEHASAFCYFYKTGSVQKIVHDFKYKNNPDLAYYMGFIYGKTLKDSQFINEINYLIPVPLHPKREKKRGYNQAYEICRGLSDATKIPIAKEAIKRTINNPSQTKHSRTERWKNVEGIFSRTDTVDLHGKSILLVDDVITTGSTIEAIANCIKNDDTKIYIAAIAVAM